MSGWQTLDAPAKLNLALVVGPLRTDGRHEVVTALERLTLADTVSVRQADAIRVDGYDDDTLVRAALEVLSRSTGGELQFEARIEKRIPVASGLGGGSSDAAAALLLANDLLDTPLSAADLGSAAASLGADVPFFLCDGPQLGTGDGTTLAPLVLPRDYTVLLALPEGTAKSSTADVYAAFDARRGAVGFAERRDRLLRAVDGGVATTTELAALPPNDLATTPVAGDLLALGAFRADTTGAGPVVYGLFADRDGAETAEEALGARVTATWVSEPG